MDRFLPTPRAYPNKCHRCARGGPDNGPYLETEWSFVYPHQTGMGTLSRLYICFECFRNYMNAEGSPFDEPIAQMRKLEEDLGASEQLIADLQERLAHSETALAAYQKNIDTIADRVAERMMAISQALDAPRAVARRKVADK